MAELETHRIKHGDNGLTRHGKVKSVYALLKSGVNKDDSSRQGSVGVHIASSMGMRMVKLRHWRDAANE